MENGWEVQVRLYLPRMLMLRGGWGGVAQHQHSLEVQAPTRSVVGPVAITNHKKIPILSGSHHVKHPVTGWASMITTAFLRSVTSTLGLPWLGPTLVPWSDPAKCFTEQPGWVRTCNLGIASRFVAFLKNIWATNIHQTYDMDQPSI